MYDFRKWSVLRVAVSVNIALSAFVTVDLPDADGPARKIMFGLLDCNCLEFLSATMFLGQ